MEVANEPNSGAISSLFLQGTSTTTKCNHKNLLQQHVQRSASPLPIYQTVNEGPQNALRFRSTVFVDGAAFISSVFPRLKDAEQDAARIALEGISWKIKHEGVSLIQNDTMFCKSILHEYATKMKIERPTYTTVESKGVLRLFATSVVFDGKFYQGRNGPNKRVSEQIAARTVIESILGSSDSRTTMSEIIKSKSRLYDAMNGRISPCLTQDINTTLVEHTENDSNKGKEMQVPLTNEEVPEIKDGSIENISEKDVELSLRNDNLLAIVDGDSLKNDNLLAIVDGEGLSSVVDTPVNPNKTLKEESTCDNSVSVGNPTSLSPSDKANQPTGSADAQCAQESNVPLDGPPVVSNSTPDMPKKQNSRQKRSERKRSGGSAKRARTANQ